MATDFRDGKAFPRRGRELIGGFMWLLRVFDKGRASAAGTLFDYIYPCPMDKGVFQRWGITPTQFDEALRGTKTDQDIFKWVGERVSEEARESANAWLVDEKAENLDRQDLEESLTP
ncbi:MAG: DUF5069 domain-containing protein [Candidatus Baltobacteraceae bacterium]